MKTTPEKIHMALRRSWWYGFAFSMGMDMLIQDYLGLEGYIRLVRANWTELPWIIGLLIAAAGIFFYVGMMQRFDWLIVKEKEDGS